MVFFVCTYMRSSIFLAVSRELCWRYLCCLREFGLYFCFFFGPWLLAVLNCAKLSGFLKLYAVDTELFCNLCILLFIYLHGWIV